MLKSFAGVVIDNPPRIPVRAGEVELEALTVDDTARVAGICRTTVYKALHPDPGYRGDLVDSRFKCDTELKSEGFQRGLEGEAFARRGVERPEQGIEVVIAVVRQGGVPRDVATQHAVGVLDAAPLPGAVGIAEVGPHGELGT